MSKLGHEVKRVRTVRRKRRRRKHHLSARKVVRGSIATWSKVEVRWRWTC